MRVECRAARGFVFLGRERGFQLCVFLCPIAFAFIESVRYRTPSGVAGKRLLFVRSRIAPLSFCLLYTSSQFRLSAQDKRNCSFFVLLDNYKPHNVLYNIYVRFVQIIRQQKSNGRERKMAKKAIETAGLSEVKAEAVSYTHLDVYKRQL